MTISNFTKLQPEAEFIYLIKVKGYRWYKVGSTTKPRSRLRSLQTGCPLTLCPVFCIESKDALSKEKKIHEHLEEYRLVGEWFELADAHVKKVIALMSLPEDFKLPPAKRNKPVARSANDLELFSGWLNAQASESHISCDKFRNMSRFRHIGRTRTNFQYLCQKAVNDGLLSMDSNGDFRTAPASTTPLFSTKSKD